MILRQMANSFVFYQMIYLYSIAVIYKKLKELKISKFKQEYFLIIY